MKMVVDAMDFDGMEEEEEDLEEEEVAEGDYVKEETAEYRDTGKEKEMVHIMDRLKERENKEKAADLVSKLKGKKKVNKKIMPYEIYATSGE
ncbi:hypothetical protein C5S36_14940 [Candidatus Methanophagaceae archaeon]|nr:hypothetical protein C5S36_14940 [Methanophagales archaeon]